MTKKYPWVVIIIVTILSVVSIGVLKQHSDRGVEMTLKHSALINSALEAKYELTSAHLWFEEYIGGDADIELEPILQHIKKTRSHLEDMIRGSRSNSAHYITPFSKSESDMSDSIEKALDSLDLLLVMSIQRNEDHSMHGIDSDVDTLYDLIFNQAIEAISFVESKIHKNIDTSLKEFIYERNLLMALVAFINLFVIFSYRYIRNFEKEWLQAYFKTKEEKDELLRSRVVVDEYIPISTTDLAGNITYVNSAMCKLTGYSKDELIGQNHRILKPSSTSTSISTDIYENLWKTITSNQHWEGKVENVSKCGKHYWIKLYISPLNDEEGKIVGYQGVRRDISNEKKLEYVSNYDTLTGTYNRKWFNEQISYKIQQFNRYKYVFSVILIDIDHFKNVNDTYGHQVGDAVLIQCAMVMKKSIRETDSLVRWGGEEFAILLVSTTISEATTVAEKIRKNIEEEDFDNIGSITVSCGVDQVIDNDIDQTIFERVDKKLYCAKEKGRNRVVSNLNDK